MPEQDVAGVAGVRQMSKGRRIPTRKWHWILAFGAMYVAVGLLAYSDPDAVVDTYPTLDPRPSGVFVFLVKTCALASGAAVGIKTSRTLTLPSKGAVIIIGFGVGVAVSVVQIFALYIWAIFFMFFMHGYMLN